MSASVNVNELLQGAVEDGLLSGSSHRTITKVDLGQQINAALGVKIEDTETTESILVAMEIDDSGSIRMSGNAQAMRDGPNGVVEALRGSKESDSVLIMCRLLNGDMIYPYCLLDDAVELDNSNYNPNKGTPLYDETVAFLAAIATKCKEATEEGNSFRAICLIATDGADEHSHHHTADDVKGIVADLLKTEQVVVAGYGVDNGYTDFGEIFDAMGIPKEWQLTTSSDPSEIRRAFQLFSQSAVRMSQAAPGATSSNNMGGFGA